MYAVKPARTLIPPFRVRFGGGGSGVGVVTGVGLGVGVRRGVAVAVGVGCAAAWPQLTRITAPRVTIVERLKIAAGWGGRSCRTVPRAPSGPAPPPPDRVGTFGR